MCVCPSIFTETGKNPSLFLQRRVSYEWAFIHFQFDSRKWRNDFRDEAVMEGVGEYSGIVSVSSYRPGETWPIRSSIH